MRSNRKKNRIILLVVLLLVISIGYALVFTDLKIDGILGINKQTWDVHFENIRVKSGSITPVHAATINSQDTTKVSYEVYLENPGDYYEFEVDVVNNGTMDAMITDISSTNNGNPISLPSYIEYKAKYSSGTDLVEKHLLEAGSRDTYIIGVYFKSDITASQLENSQPLNLRLVFDVTYSQADDTAIDSGNIRVTFNPNGGSVNKTSKMVNTSGTYGGLPTPTREGYIFNGWYGKNLVDYDKFTNPSYWSTTLVAQGSYPTNGGNPGFVLSTEVGKTYTVSMVPLSDTQFPKYLYLCKIENGEGKLVAYMTTSEDSTIRNRQYTFEAQEGVTYFMRVGSTLGNMFNEQMGKLVSFQLEEGNASTDYETHYITSSTNVERDSDFTLKAEWVKARATFILGTQFNVKAKTLAGDTLRDDYPYLTKDTNITRIIRANSLPNNFNPTENNIVSTSNSDVPIYIWYDNGTLYYYTEAINPYMYVYSQNMFRNFAGATEIDVNTIDISETKSLHAMFMDCSKLEHLNISSWDTIDVGTVNPDTAMTHLFHGDSSLIDITFGTNFKTSLITSIQDMFNGCSSLQTLDLSNFDFGNVTVTTDTLKNATGLTSLKTPKVYPIDTTVSITLPNTFYNGNTQYTVLDSTSPTETLLTTN